MIRPPRLAEKFFDWYAGRAKVEDLKGDLNEWFYLHAEQKSLRHARLQYWKQVLSLLMSYALKKRKEQSRYGAYHSSSFSIAMIQNYLKVALRNLYQHRYFTLLNSFGLAIGMSISLLMIAMYGYIRTYDNFHREKEKIYSLSTQKTEGKDSRHYASAPTALADKLAAEFNGTQAIVKINSTLRGQVVLDNLEVPLRGYYVDPSFFDVFHFTLQYGNASRALLRPQTIVLTPAAAVKLFGQTNVVGKSVVFAGAGTFEVTGVLEEMPRNTHFEFEAIASYASILPAAKTHDDLWTNYEDEYVYVKLTDAAQLVPLQQSLARIQNEEYKETNAKVEFVPLAIDEIVTQELRNSIGPLWEYSGLVVFGVVSLLILLPGIFNYTNISIARSLKRSKEIGLRKTMGGAKGQIFFQFITETVLICLLSLVCSVLIFMAIRAEFKTMLVESSAIDLSITPWVAASFVVFALLVGFVAGFFPALHFARLNPIQALKSKASRGRFSASGIRKGLTVFQFALSFGFILSVVVFSREYQRILHFDFGFRKDNILAVGLAGAKPSESRNAFSDLSSVQQASLSSGTIGLSSSATMAHFTHEVDSLESQQLFIDDAFLKIFGLQLVAGENFPGSTDQEKYLLVNEAFVEKARLGSAHDALGKTFIIDSIEMTVRGVVKNFYFGPPSVPIGSFLFRNNVSEFSQANLLLANTDAFRSINQIESTWKKLAPHQVFDASFINEQVNDAYSSYQVLVKIIGFLGLLAITVSMLGLLGMVVYSSETRQKEVSVRKVLGASVGSITSLLSKDYASLIGWAIALGLPLTWLLFQHVVSLIPRMQVMPGVWDVLISCLLLLTVGMATILSQTYKTAKANPAEALKCE